MSNLIQNAKKNILNAIVEQYTVFLNNIFKVSQVRAIWIDSLIDWEYIYFIPQNLADFTSKLDKIRKIVKEWLWIEIKETDLEKSVVPINNIPTETKVFYIQFPKNIQDMEEFDYGQFKEIFMQVMIWKLMDWQIKVLENIESKIVCVHGTHNSGITNLKNVLESEVKSKHKKVNIVDVVSIADFGWVPNKNGIYFLENIEWFEEELKDNKNPNFVFIDLLDRGFGYIYEKEAFYKLRTFKYLTK